MNKTANYQLTIIVPVYNEEGNILRLEKELGEFLKNAKVTSCVLFVNDGSKDDSERLIRDVCGRNEAFFFLNLARNGGLSAAMKAGIDNSFSKWVGYIDADLQTTPQDFNKLLEFVDQYEMVMGIRTGRKDSFVKNMSSRIANGFRRMMTVKGFENGLCQKDSLLHGNASFPASLDPIAGRTSETGPGTPLPTYCRKVKVQPGQSFGGTV